MDSPAPRPAPAARPVRWWPLWLIVSGSGLAIALIRFWPELSYQQRNIATAQVVVIPLLLVVVWAAFFSRLRRRAKAAWLGAILGSILLACVLFRIHGVSGDLVPILEWRFRPSTRASSTSIPPTGPAPPRARPASPRPRLVHDYAQFLGPHRNGTVDGPTLAHDWAAHAPRLLWRRAVGAAWAGFAVAGDLAVTLEQRGEEETVVGYDWYSGQPLWTHADAAHYHTTIAGEGPRTTPTIVSNRVYTLGATGLLNCLDLATGHLIWRQDVPKDHGGKVGEWGVSCSPLVLNNQVIVTTGAGDGHSLAAYDAGTGTRLWTAGDDRASYSSPLAAVLGGSLQVLIFNSTRLTAHEAASGAVLWEYRWPAGHPHIVAPLVLSNDQLVVSSGYGVGSELLKVQRSPEGPWSVRRLWKSNRLKSKFANLIYHGGYLYGLDDGIMTCLDAATGERKWKEGRYGHGQMILNGDRLLVVTESGDVVLIQPAPEQLRELTRFNALSGKTWNPPALAGCYLLVRNDREAACFQLPTAETPSPHPGISPGKQP
jgi:outer membrane protein assembly factor BamB